MSHDQFLFALNHRCVEQDFLLRCPLIGHHSNPGRIRFSWEMSEVKKNQEGVQQAATCCTPS
jgi:hypothetical protein